MRKITFNFVTSERGAAAIVALLATAAVVLALGLTIAIKGSLEASGSKRLLTSNDAFYAAESGVEDGLVKIERNKSYNTAAVTCSYDATIHGYGLAVASSNVCVAIPSGASKDITATATENGVTRTVVVTVAVDATTGIITTSNWRES